MNISYFNYILLRLLTAPFALLPFKAIHRIGNFLGLALYHLYPKYRKRALSNISLASALLLSEEQIIALAKASLKNLVITALEYPKLAKEKEIHRIATCENPEKANEIMRQGKGLIFFCGHQANWEILFLEGTRRMPGVAIGRPIKNTYLYNWILKMRQKYGGKIVAKQNAAREGLRALKKGAFLGIVGDQGLPEGGFCSPFLGRNAWTSPLPAILSHRSGAPIIVSSVRREKGKYFIRYSEPIWPNPEEDLPTATSRMMNQALQIFEKSVLDNPAQWLWIHNRWKQQPAGRIARRFQHDSLLIILPEDSRLLLELYAHLSVFRTLYPKELIAIAFPAAFAHLEPPFAAEKYIYHTPQDLHLGDLRFKLVFNFSPYQHISRHLLRRSTFTAITLKELQSSAGPCDNFAETLQKVILDAS